MSKCKCTMLRRIEVIERLPDGVYNGVWGGSVVRFTIQGQDYEAQAESCIRTPRTTCLVTSKDGQLTVETYKAEVTPESLAEGKEFLERYGQRSSRMMTDTEVKNLRKSRSPLRLTEALPPEPEND